MREHLPADARQVPVLVQALVEGLGRHASMAAARDTRSRETRPGQQ